MKNKGIKLIIILIFCLCLINVFNNESIVFAKNNNAGKLCEFSDEYLEWLKLPEEERKKYFRPEICKNEEIIINDFFTPNLYSFYNDFDSTNDTLPEKYDLRNVNGISYVTSVKDQKETGLCWAFSSLSVIESNLKREGLDYDLSETHVGYSTSYYFKDGVNEEGRYDYYAGEGGRPFETFSTYTTNGKGPILESEMNFDDYYNYDAESGLDYSKYLKEINLSEIQNKTVVIDINKIKNDHSSNGCTNEKIKQIKN